MLTPTLVLQLIALACLICAAIGIPTAPSRVSLGWLGLFFWLLSVLVH